MSKFCVKEEIFLLRRLLVEWQIQNKLKVNALHLKDDFDSCGFYGTLLIERLKEGLKSSQQHPF